ncbi:MAG: Asp-tRNA(Asn)/Glu-tRNA(Gln) amidotransferase subunit GatB, partial [Chloroflexi bacterium]|nr:Asp-tRNA(Asn)/Glu-tRNA(Gln) amidotransferase subunit GatB [Chloroflexota bacterium]
SVVCEYWMSTVVEFEPVIGLEVHAELQTQSKMFCACPVVDTATATPNSATCEICTGMPGSLPVINAKAVEYALRVALALHATPAERSSFARKNYFYPDLPKGYQISQYALPLAEGGFLEIECSGAPRRIRIRRVHLEEDTGKLFHRDGYSLVDYNRSGVALLEIVTEPDLHSLEEVKAYASELRLVLRTLGVNSGDMEKGVIRFEANISLRPAGSSGLGTRTEIKNLNSFRSMLRAVAFEMERQADYRYFPEPDLPPLYIEKAFIESIRVSLPELPSERRARWQRDLNLTHSQAGVLAAEPAAADFFEAAAQSAPTSRAVQIANWTIGELFGILRTSGTTIEACRVIPQALADLVAMVDSGELTTANGKAVLAEMFATGEAAEAVVTRRGLKIINDADAVAGLVRQVLAAHPEQLAQYIAGKTTIRQWFFGQVMRLAAGQASPARVQQALQEALQSAENHHGGL